MQYRCNYIRIYTPFFNINWYVKYASFHWPLLEAALSILNFIIFVKTAFFFEMELMKAKKIAISAK